MALGPVFNGSPVGQAGEGIRKCQFLQEKILGLDLPMKSNIPEANTHARQLLSL